MYTTYIKENISYQDQGYQGYLQLLTSKHQQAYEHFHIDTYDIIMADLQAQYPLKMYCKNNLQGYTNVCRFYYEYTLPTTLYHYKMINNNLEYQKSIDQFIDSYYCIKNIYKSIDLIYLSYKKFLFVKGRDFVYLKHNFYEEGAACTLTTSDETHKYVPDKIRGKIIVTLSKAIQQDNNVYVRVYSHIDLKMKLSPYIVRQNGSLYIKKYLDKLYASCLKHPNPKPLYNNFSSIKYSN